MNITRAKLFVRSLNNSGAKILLAFIMAHSTLDVKELRDWTGMKRETIYDGLRTLQSLEMVQKQVVSHGRIVWLPAAEVLPGFGQVSGKRTSDLLQESEKGTPEIIQMSGKRTSIPVQESEKGTSEPQVSGKRTPLLLVVGGSTDLTDRDQTPTPPDLNEQESEKRTSDLPSVHVILQHTDLLFDGSVVHSKGLEGRDPLEVLAWCAYAYQQKDRLSAPGGLVRNRLLENQPAMEWARNEWYATLPEPYLAALGFRPYACPVCDATFADPTQLDEHLTQHPIPADEPDDEPAVDDSITVRISPTGPTATELWQQVLEQLQGQMARAGFETWVRDTQLVRFDGNVLTVAAHNTDARDWLRDRLTTTVNRVLIGVAARSDLQVEFVTEGELI